MPENKTKPTGVSVAAFIASVPDPDKRAAAKALVKIMQAATGEKPKMWGPSIIGFGRYRYRLDTGREGDMPLVCFSPRKPDIVLYLHLDGADALLRKLGKYRTGKSCMYVKDLSDLDQGVLLQLVERTVAASRRRDVRTVQ